LGGHSGGIESFGRGTNWVKEEESILAVTRGVEASQQDLMVEDGVFANAKMEEKAVVSPASKGKTDEEDVEGAPTRLVTLRRNPRLPFERGRALKPKGGQHRPDPARTGALYSLFLVSSGLPFTPIDREALICTGSMHAFSLGVAGVKTRIQDQHWP
jgi:hypothetical protein